MNKNAKFAIVAGLIIVVGIVLATKNGKKSGTCGLRVCPTPTTSVATRAAPVALPRLVDLGSDTCLFCRKMAPILEDLAAEYFGRVVVEVIDVRKNPQAGRKYGVRVIPTQIFLDASGKELFRHEGFMSKEDILAKWKELGIHDGI